MSLNGEASLRLVVGFPQAISRPYCILENPSKEEEGYIFWKTMFPKTHVSIV